MILEDEAIALRLTAEAIERNSIAITQSELLLEHLQEGNVLTISLAVQVQLERYADEKSVEFFRIDEDLRQEDTDDVIAVESLSIEALKRCLVVLERREKQLKKRMLEIIETGETDD